MKASQTSLKKEEQHIEKTEAQTNKELFLINSLVRPSVQ